MVVILCVVIKYLLSSEYKDNKKFIIVLGSTVAKCNSVRLAIEGSLLCLRFA